MSKIGAEPNYDTTQDYKRLETKYWIQKEKRTVSYIVKRVLLQI